MVELHGRGIGPAMFDRWTGFGELADEAGFALAMPSAIREIWNDGRYSGSTWGGHTEIDDVGFLLAVIDDVIEHHAIDPARVYLVGMSNGATMAGRVAWEHPNRIAAVAQVAGTGAVGLISEQRPAVPVPLLQIHGTRDKFAPYAGGRAGRWLRLFGRRPIVPNMSVDEWARMWVERNGCGGHASRRDGRARHHRPPLARPHPCLRRRLLPRGGRRSYVAGCPYLDPAPSRSRQPLARRDARHLELLPGARPGPLGP